MAITIWFQNLFTPQQGFFSAFPHGTKYAIGLEMYLGLGVDATQIQTQYPMHPTQETRKDLQSHILTGLSPSTVQPFQVNFSLTKKDPNQVQNTTSPHTSQYGIQFVLHRFRSPLLTISHIAFSSSTY